jgi:hypothetical protein
LSDTAQQVLAVAAAPAQTISSGTSTTASSATAATATWSSDSVTQALAALNDTSGATSEADQMKAYKLLATLVANPANFDPGNTANIGAVDTATAFAASAFSQHVQSLMAQTGINGGSEDSEVIQRQLNTFNALSSDDQQTVVGALNVSSQISSGSTAYASVSSYIANRQALIGIDRATEAAFATPTYAQGLTANLPHGDINYDSRTAQFMSLATQAAAAGDKATAALVPLAHGVDMNSDAFTAKAQAYFAQYGAPPAVTQDQLAQDAAPAAAATTVVAKTPSASEARTAFQILATLNDSSGASSLTDKLQAYKAFTGGALFNAASYGPLRTALVTAGWQSSFTNRVQADAIAYQGKLFADGTPGAVIEQAHLNNLNNLSADDQQIVFSQQGPNAAFASLDSFKANGQAKIGIDNLIEQLYSKYNVNHYSKITDGALTGTAAFKQLVQLIQNPNEQTDAWTAQAQNVLNLWGQFSATSLNTASDANDAGTTAAQTALKALTDRKQSMTSATVALQMLQNSASAKVASLTQTASRAKLAAGAYAPGDRFKAIA